MGQLTFADSLHMLPWKGDTLPIDVGGFMAKTYTAVVERCPDTELYVGYVPGFPGAHSQGGTLDELNENLREVIELLSEEGEVELQGQFVGTQQVTVGWNPWVMSWYFLPEGSRRSFVRMGSWKFARGVRISSSDIRTAGVLLFLFTRVKTSLQFCSGRSPKTSA